MIKTYCNYCGKEVKSPHAFELFMGYGSKYDGDTFSVDLCDECADKLIDFMRPLCKYDPLVPSGMDSE